MSSERMSDEAHSAARSENGAWARTEPADIAAGQHVGCDNDNAPSSGVACRSSRVLFTGIAIAKVNVPIPKLIPRL